MEIPGMGSNYQIIIEEIDGVKNVIINVEAESQCYGLYGGKEIEGSPGLLTQRRCIPPLGQLPRQEGKAKRVFYKDENGIR